MNYNLHPIFVHFPIALLFIYSFLRIVPFKKFIPQINWVDARRVVLAAGVLGAFVALATGEQAEHLVNNHQLVEVHSAFATAATWLYVAILAGEVAGFTLHYFSNILDKNATVKKIFILVNKVLGNNALSLILSLVALTALVIAGILGGALVYGTTADPLAGILLNLLGISL